MPTSTPFKYNPGVLGDPELVQSFVVRHQCLNLIMEALRENSGSANSNGHLLVVGPRGIGKTMLVRRVAAEVRSNQDYSTIWLPIVYGEESYQVTSAGEFWLEALVHLFGDGGDPKSSRTLDELREETNDARLRERALAQLLDASSSRGKRLLLVVENLHMLCQQITDEAAWELRHTLTNEPRIMLLGTATSRFKAIDQASQAWFEMFAVHELKPLGRDDSRILWHSISNQDLKPGQVRAIRILTGGNPRLVTVLASFAANKSFNELMDQLVHLIDDHTEYFKGHLDVLPAKERKVFVALLEQWNPVTAADLARTTRMTVNEVSALLNRLVARGAVEVFKQRPRRKLYQAAERLYNIYYLMRRRGQPSDRVRAAVSFMVMFYGGRQLVTTIADLALEACRLPAGKTEDHYLAYSELIRRVPRKMRHRALDRTPPEFFGRGDAPDFIRQLPERSRLDLVVERAWELLVNEQWSEAEQALRDVVATHPNLAGAWHALGWAFNELDRPEEAEQAYRRVAEIDPEDAGNWRELASVLEDLNRFEQAEQAYRKLVDLDPMDAGGWRGLASVLEDLYRFEEAEQVYRKLVEIGPKDAWNWHDLGSVLMELKRFEEAEQAYRKALEPDPKDAWGWNGRGSALQRLGWLEEAEQAHRNAVEADPKDPWSWDELGSVLEDLKRFEEAEQAYRKALKADPKDVWAWNGLGSTLRKLDRLDEAQEAHRSAVEADPKDVWGWNGLAMALKGLGRLEEAEQTFRKVLEIDPRHLFGWIGLGVVLEDLDRFEEAEQAFRRAIEIAPKEAAAWAGLGNMLWEQDQSAEAEQAYRKAIELDPTEDTLWGNLGHLISEGGSAADAEKVWAEALQLHPSLVSCAVHLLEARLEQGQSSEALLLEAEEWTERAGRTITILDSMARFVLRSKVVKGLPQAENWAREAWSREQTVDTAKTLALVSLEQGKWKDALEASRFLLDRAADSEQARATATDLMIRAAAAGYAKEASQAIVSSKGANALEPLLIGVQIYLGETPQVAKEIYEIAQDVAERIRETERDANGSSDTDS